nr:MAG TPA: hypothetical protein [Caudoviricetes sp.]
MHDKKILYTLDNAYYTVSIERWLFEVENFVRSTRRWYDRGNPRDAGDTYACRIVIFS